MAIIDPVYEDIKTLSRAKRIRYANKRMKAAMEANRQETISILQRRLMKRAITKAEFDKKMAELV